MTRAFPHQLLMSGICRGLPRRAMGHYALFFAYEVLVDLSGQDFGLDCKQWNAWAATNRKTLVYGQLAAEGRVRQKWFPYWSYVDDLQEDDSHPYSAAIARKALEVLKAISGEAFNDYPSWEAWVLQHRSIFLEKHKCYSILKEVEIERYPYDLLYAKLTGYLASDDPRFVLGNPVSLLVELTGEDFSGQPDKLWIWILKNIELFEDEAVLTQWRDAIRARLAKIEAAQKPR